MPSIQNSDKSENITLRCSAELKKAVRIAAAEQASSIEDLCAEVLTRALMPNVEEQPEPKRKRA